MSAVSCIDDERKTRLVGVCHYCHKEKHEEGNQSVCFSKGKCHALRVIKNCAQR